MSMNFLTFACGFGMGAITALIGLAIAVVRAERADEKNGGNP